MSPRIGPSQTGTMVLALLCALPSSSGPAQAQRASPRDDFELVVRPFLAAHCFACHGPDIAKSGLRLDQLASSAKDERTAQTYRNVRDQLHFGVMPPEDSPRPPAEDVLGVLVWLERELTETHRTGVQTSTDLRRLNRREFRNALRDLLCIDTTRLDTVRLLPPDDLVEGLDTIGAALTFEDTRLEAMLAAAERAVHKALAPRRRPEPRVWRFDGDFRQQSALDEVHRALNDFRYLALYEVTAAEKHEGAYAPLLAFSAGVPFDGIYELRIEAEAVDRRSPHAGLLGTNPDEPLLLGIVPGDREAGELHLPQPFEPLLAEIELADERRPYTVRVFLEAGTTPRFTFRNGPMDIQNLYGRVVAASTDTRRRLPRGIVERRRAALTHGRLPHIRIHTVEIEGPFYEVWPTPAQRTLLGDDWERVESTGELDRDTALRHLARFARAAYRRVPDEGELARLARVVDASAAAGLTPLDSFAQGLVTVLLSPSFLFLEEPEGRLPPRSLAARLAAFLWSSIPDAELSRVAADGSLESRPVLAAQCERMLDEARAAAFVESFLDNWIDLRELGRTPPDRRAHYSYYRYELLEAMREETLRFTADLLARNGSVLEFLSAKHSFLDERLARHYGLELAHPPGQSFERVELHDPRRGGLLGQASVLTLTANGIDTSPVVRGVWLLERILGTPAPPPPPGVSLFEPDLRGTLTIRSQLEQHRDVDACRTCHAKIDPFGFAFESFDPVGAWRDRYENGQKIDTSGELPGGRSFTDVVGLKNHLLELRADFLRNLVTRLTEQATGRLCGARDLSEVQAIVGRALEESDGFRDLVVAVVQSEAFRTK